MMILAHRSSRSSSSKAVPVCQQVAVCVLALCVCLLVDPASCTETQPTPSLVDEFRHIDFSTVRNIMPRPAPEQPNPEYYPQLFEGGATESDKKLMDWAFANGVQISDAMVIKQSGSFGTGVFHRRDMHHGESLIRVPAAMQIYSSQPRLTPKTKAALQLCRERFRQPGIINEVPQYEMTEIGLILALEKVDPNSFYKPYLDTVLLPTAPLFYTDQEMELFEMPNMKEEALDLISGAMVNFRALMNDSKLEPYRFPNQDLIFAWAIEVILARSFAWKHDERMEYVIVPIIDHINHDLKYTATYFFQPPNNATHPSPHLDVAVHGNRSAGSEAFITYHSNSPSTHLLMQYGFVTRDNPNDHLNLQLIIPETLSTELTERLARMPNADSVGLNGIVSVDFIRSINLAWKGVDKVTVEAYELVLQGVQKKIKSFKTTLKQDLDFLKENPNTDFLHWSAAAFRIELKKLLRVTERHLQACVSDLSDGLPAKDFESNGMPTSYSEISRIVIEVPNETGTTKAPNTATAAGSAPIPSTPNQLKTEL